MKGTELQMHAMVVEPLRAKGEVVGLTVAAMELTMVPTGSNSSRIEGPKTNGLDNRHY